MYIYIYTYTYILEGNVTKFVPRKDLKFISGGKMSFDDERVVLHRVDCHEINNLTGCLAIYPVRVSDSGVSAIAPPHGSSGISFLPSTWNYCNGSDDCTG